MKVWVEAQQLENLGRGRAPVAFEGVGRWIMATDVLAIALTSVIVGYGYHSLVLGQPSEVLRYLTIGAMFAALSAAHRRDPRPLPLRRRVQSRRRS